VRVQAVVAKVIEMETVPLKGFSAGFGNLALGGLVHVAVAAVLGIVLIAVVRPLIV
jgi:hypothetical protein